MLKALPIAIGGIAGTGFFGTWGISQASNSSKHDGWKWLRLGTDAIISESQRTKGIAIKIPNNDFKLNCEKLKNNSESGCIDIKEKLKEIQTLVKSTGIGLKNYVKDDPKWTKDKECGTINWSNKEKESNTNLLGLSKFLLRIYCLEAKEKNKGEKFKQEFIDDIDKISNSLNEGGFIGGIFNTKNIWSDLGKAPIKSEIKENLKKLIKSEDEKLTKWIEILSKLLDNKKLSLQIKSNSSNQRGGQWLFIQKN